RRPSPRSEPGPRAHPPRHDVFREACSSHLNMGTRPADEPRARLRFPSPRRGRGTRLRAMARPNDAAPERTQHPQNLVWLDLEMTGLEVESHVILQAALIVTDADLRPLEEF